MRYIIADLEATCDEQGFPLDRMETIEIGAICLNSAGGPVVGEFGAFVRPVVTRTLSAFCTTLTGITQSDVESAEPFYDVFARFVEWCTGEGEPFVFGSWGNYDLTQLQRDCARHKTAFPAALLRHINIKAEFSRQYAVKPMGMMGALKHLKITPEGRHHRGIDDARNIAKIATYILPEWEKQRDDG